MHRKLWFWFLVGWAFSLVFSPAHLTGMFKTKSAS
jgi:hypothetical protein